MHLNILVENFTERGCLNDRYACEETVLGDVNWTGLTHISIHWQMVLNLWVS